MPMPSGIAQKGYLMTVVVVLGGDASFVDLSRSDLPPGAVVVAADSGLDAARAAGIPVHHVIGDFDSVDPQSLAEAEASGVHIHRHPADKDATDGELALDLAVSLAAGLALSSPPEVVELVVLGGGGGRLDHLLADVLALAAPALAHLDVTAHFGLATITIVRPGRPRMVAGQVGEQVSLLPIHGRARGVSTNGLRWALVDADLVAGTTRAVSNEFLAPSATVAVAQGALAVIQPGTQAAKVNPRTTPYNPTPTA